MSRADKAHPHRDPDYQEFVVMEQLLEKLKLLNYEKFLDKYNLKHLNRHYFVSSPYLPSDPDEQFRAFSVVAAWLINAAGRAFPLPKESHNPAATAANILAELRALDVKVRIQPCDLTQGSGKFVCFVLDQLADKALRKTGLSYRKPTYPTESERDESVREHEAERSLDSQEEDEVSDRDEILESAVDPAEWALEVQRVLPQLTAPTEADVKAWRSHVEQMHRHRDRTDGFLEQARSFLHRLQEDMCSSMKKLSSREHAINFQLKHRIQEFRDGQAKMTRTAERYDRAAQQMRDRSRVLAEVNDNLREAKRQMEERGGSMTDCAPVVKINQSLAKLKQEVADMDVRISVLQHMLLHVKLKEKRGLMRDVYAADASAPRPAPSPPAAELFGLQGTEPRTPCPFSVKKCH